jgi:hypothetical protein
MQATSENLFPGSTLLSYAGDINYANGTSNYSYDPASGWITAGSTTSSQIIKNEDIALLNGIANTGLYSQSTIAADIQAVNSAINSGVGKSIITDIYAANPAIMAKIRSDQGDISMFFSTIQTLQGGNVDLETPNGGVNAGLSLGLQVKPASDLGIIVQGQGDINILARNDLQVNQQRIVTLGGGDITAGSLEGSVNAGRGVAGAGALAPPSVTYDSNGNAIITILPDLSQSGIRSASPVNSNIIPGNIGLFAARGTIDAGEAGVGGFKVKIDGPCTNCGNINGNSVSIGSPAPAPSGGVTAGLSGSSGLTAGVTKALETTVGSANNDEAAASRARASNVLGILSVDLLGFGED